MAPRATLSARAAVALSFVAAWAQAGEDATCNTAGIARAAFRSREAVTWLSQENARRAPYYIAKARRMYQKALRQQMKLDKSNDDPFIALYDAQHQVLGALDLAPDNASIWARAGQATAMIASLSEDRNQVMEKAVDMLAKACEMDGASVDTILAWARKKPKDEHDALTKVRQSIGKTVSKWKKDGVPTAAVEHFLPVITGRQSSEVCAEGASMPPMAEDVQTEKAPSGQIKAALASMEVRPLFPTLITSVNVVKHFGKGFCEKLADLAIKKYRAFSTDRKKKGQTDPNDINDAFFSAQARNWPELYRSDEYKQLKSFMTESLIEHAKKTGYGLSKEDIKKSQITLWAAIYLEDGGRHGYHVHQGSLSSCVFYAKAPSGRTPLMFVDPRGAPPTHDYEQHHGEHDFEPVAPFHHNYHFFAEAGDVVCFPSWLVHRVPSHYEAEERVAFPANLQADKVWDSWYRSSTLS